MHSHSDEFALEVQPHVEPHDHAVFLYEEQAELEEALGAFLQDGVGRRELAVFVHSFPRDDEAWSLIERANGESPKLRADDIVVVSLYRDAFEGPTSRIDHPHVMAVIGSLLAKAQAQGRAGVRIFVDASRVYFAEGRTREWFDFEAWLGKKLQSSLGLVCAYRRQDALRPDVFPEVLRTHAYRFDVTRRK